MYVSPWLLATRLGVDEHAPPREFASALLGRLRGRSGGDGGGGGRGGGGDRGGDRGGGDKVEVEVVAEGGGVGRWRQENKP